MNRRFEDTRGRPSRRQITRLAFLLAGVLITLSSASLLYIAYIASEEAGRQARANQRQLLTNALDDRFVLLSRDLVSLACWDAAVRHVSLEFDPGFVRDEYMDSLWYDFGHEQSLLVDGDDRVLAISVRGAVQFPNRQLAADDRVRQLVDRARDRYFRRRVPLPGGFGLDASSAEDLSTAVESGYLVLEDVPAMVGAMAIIPDDGGAVLPDGRPVVLVTATLIDEELTEELNAQLAFTDLRFTPAAPGGTRQIQQPILAAGGEQIGVLQWTGRVPGTQIWATVIPVIALLAAFLSLVAFGIAWRLGRLTSSLAVSEEHNRYLAMHDTLSGLANRLCFNRELEAAVAGLPARPFVLMHCDLDRFKEVNDVFGHAAGDAVIKAVAGRLTDIVGTRGLVGRTGGDEFVILLAEDAPRQDLEELARRIGASLSAPVSLEHGGSACIGVSIGIARAPGDGASARDIMAAADAALYAAKNAGRGRAEFFADRQGAGKPQ